MSFCPNCGNALWEGDYQCRSCGFRFAPPPAAPGISKGLKAAIIIVACLCVITAGTWIAWPKAGPVSAGSTTPLTTTHTPTAAPGAQQPAQTTPPAQPLPLYLGSWWKGELVVSDYSGPKNMEGERMNVWAQIAADANGTPFFEVYDSPNVESDPNALVSFYIDLYRDHFVPVIGDGDAWFLDLELNQTDTAPLTVYSSSSSMTIQYRYNNGSESFLTTITLYPDN